jgi:mono/diheme cytochrome c family protein
MSFRVSWLMGLLCLAPCLANDVIERDWRMQDGIGTERNPATFADAIKLLLQRGDALIADLHATGGDVAEWERLRHAVPSEETWRKLHQLRRRIALKNPLAQTGPLLFIKQVPSCFSHQLTQYYGSCARPGGGVFALEEPGVSMRCRQLATALPPGSFQHPEVSFDGRRVLFAYCPVPSTPPNRETHLDRFYHLYEMSSDGGGLRQLTSGAFDDFAPRYLPDGRLVFISTRRGGFHRCGRGPCPTYTLATANADGSEPRTISFHETHEWDPAVLNDGRIIYTRWDYVDRNAVHYQQLWTIHPDGSHVRAFYGNHTLNPVGVWEARAVPGSPRVMATAAAHHAMTAGSIILLDTTRGLDGAEPITRLTPDALFPESEAPVLHSSAGKSVWHAPAGVAQPPAVPPEAARWPGHCYRSPWPLSEKYFLAAYSFAPLIGEPSANPPNQFGLYLVDSFGNKELLYRDDEISSLWPVPLRARPRPPVCPTVAAAETNGTFFLQNVHAAWPALPDTPITKLRILQVLPKTTPHANAPMLGLANASPGKQVLGTVPVESDGSAFFRAPAGIGLAFQALDAQGQAVQTMRSITYLQPGEHVSCIGCHEPRASAPAPRSTALALQRPPSDITPGPDGSRPLSYPLLVQPVLDKHCIGCHGSTALTTGGGEKPRGGLALTGQAQGHYTVSYNALAPRVSFSAWGGKPGDFRVANSEPLTQPDFFGARASPLMKMLRRGHQKVALGPDDFERLATWMDANALFYGTFDVAAQARQQRSERIAGPALE